MIYFPVIGLALGLVLALINYLLAPYCAGSPQHDSDYCVGRPDWRQPPHALKKKFRRWRSWDIGEKKTTAAKRWIYRDRSGDFYSKPLPSTAWMKSCLSAVAGPGPRTLGITDFRLRYQDRCDENLAAFLLSR